MAIEVLNQAPGRIMTFGENMILLSGGGLPSGGGNQPAAQPSSQDAGGGAFSPTATQTLASSAESPPSTQPAPGPSYPTPPSSTLSVPAYAPPAGLGPYGDLFKSLTQGVGEAYKGLGGLASQYSEKAGPYRTYESTGAEATLGAALQPKGAIEPAAKILKSEYKGPMGLSEADQATSDRLTQSVGALEAQRRALGTGMGIQDLLSQYAPGITPGEARHESRSLAGNQGFQGALGAVQGDISNLYGTLYGLQGGAEAIGKARTAQEADIAKRAQQYLSGRESAITAPIQARAAELAAQDAATQAAWNKFQDTGDWRDLLGQTIQGETGSYGAEGLYSPQAQALDRGKARWASIMADFPNLKDIPVMQMGSTGTGRQTLQFDPEWWAAHKGEHTDAEWATIKQQARQRNKALVEAGFSPFAQDYRTPEVSFTSAGPGEYGGIMPMYFALENFAPQDLRAYLELQDAAPPSIENLATGDEKAILNRINEIRGIQDRYDPNTQPYEHKLISGEVDRYLKEAEALARKVLEQGKAGGAEFLQAVSAERNREKERKKKRSFMGRVGSAGIGTLKHDPTAIPRGAGVLK
jgi:hypothetical protein